MMDQKPDEDKSQATDEQLLIGLRAKEPEASQAFNLLFRRYAPRLNCYRRWIHNDDDFDDYVCQIWLDVIAQAEQIKTFRFWYSAVARRAAVDYVKRDQSQRQHSPARMGDVEFCYPEALEQKDSLRLIMQAAPMRRALERLAQDNLREYCALLLHYVREQSYVEAAANVGCSESAFRSLLFRARKHLRDLYSEENSDSTLQQRGRLIPFDGPNNNSPDNFLP